MKVVAVIDDDPSMRTSVMRVLRASGYICETYKSAEEFLERLAASKANSALIDIHLGGLSGLDLCKQLAASGRFQNVILMTGIDIEALVHQHRFRQKRFYEGRGGDRRRS